MNKVEFVNKEGRFEVKALEHPIVYDGKTISEVTIRRMTAGDVESLVKTVNDGKELNWFDYPMFDVPAEALRELDGDDALSIKGAVSRFLPRFFRGETT